MGARVMVMVMLMAFMLGACAPSAATTTSATVPDRLADTSVSLARAQSLTDALDHLYGQTVRSIVASGVPDRAFYERLRATFDEPAFSRLQDYLGEEAALGFPGWNQPPGDPVSRVQQVRSSSPTCLVVAVDRSLESWWADPTPVAHDAALLVYQRLDPERDPRHLNSTGFVITHAAFRSQSPDMEARCIANS